MQERTGKRKKAHEKQKERWGGKREYTREKEKEKERETDRERARTRTRERETAKSE